MDIRASITAFVVLAGTIGSAPASAQDDAAHPPACYAPEQLVARPGENVARRHVNTFDKPPHDRPPPAAREPMTQPLRGSIRRVELPKGDKTIALTLDLCEQRGEIAGYDGAIFDILRRERVKATLFAGGKWMRSHAERAKQLITDPLFEIANHSETHRNLRRLARNDMMDEITAPDRDFQTLRAEIASAQCAPVDSEGLNEPQPPFNLFRFPFGACDGRSLDAVNDAGYLAIQWSLSSGDPDPHQGPKAITNAILKRVTPGDIIILHANGRGWHTAEAMTSLISQLKRRGFTFATVTELIQRGKPVIAQSCYDSRPGDTDRYDFATRLAIQRKRLPSATSPRTQ